MEQGIRLQRVFLLLDTCGERASVAVAKADGTVLAQKILGARETSTGLLRAIRSALAEAGLQLRELNGIGLVSGPGSFTGVRVGLALVKGLCEAAQLPMAAVSRLEVLADAGPAGAICALSAGRAQVYVRSMQDGKVCEQLMLDEDLQMLRRDASLVVVSPELAARLTGSGDVQQVELTALEALQPVLRRFEQGGSDIALTDANYVRDEGAIYRKAVLAVASVD